MTWLETKRAGESESDLPALAPVPPPAPPRAVRSATGTLLEASPPPVVPTATLPAKAPAAQIPAAVTMPSIEPAPSVAKTPAAADTREKRQQSLAGSVGDLFFSVFRLLRAIVFSLGRLTLRDWICVASGAAFMLVSLGLWKLIGK